MTSPFDPFALQPQPVDDFVVPEHEASTVVVAEKPKTVRERLMLNGGSRQRRTSTEDKKANTTKAPPVEPGKYVKPIQDFYESVGFLAMPFHPRLGMTLLSPAGELSEEDIKKGKTEPPSVAANCAVAWDNAAQQSETIRKALDRFLTVGIMGALVTAHVPIFMALAAGTKMDPMAMMENFRQSKVEDDDSE